MSRIDCSLLGVEKFLLLKALHGLKEESGKQSDSVFRKRHFPQVPAPSVPYASDNYKRRCRLSGVSSSGLNFTAFH